MTNHDMGVTTGNVVFGAPTLTINPPAKLEDGNVVFGAPTLNINPPAKLEEKASKATAPKEVESKDDVAADRNQHEG